MSMLASTSSMNSRLSSKAGSARRTRAAIQLEELLQSDHGRPIERPDLAHGQQHAGHEGLARDGVVAQRQGLPEPAEDDFLVRHEAGKPDRMDRLMDVAAGVADPLCGPNGRAG